MSEIEKQEALGPALVVYFIRAIHKKKILKYQGQGNGLLESIKLAGIEIMERREWN